MQNPLHRVIVNHGHRITVQNKSPPRVMRGITKLITKLAPGLTIRSLKARDQKSRRNAKQARRFGRMKDRNILNWMNNHHFKQCPLITALSEIGTPVGAQVPVVFPRYQLGTLLDLVLQSKDQQTLYVVEIKTGYAFRQHRNDKHMRNFVRLRRNPLCLVEQHFQALHEIQAMVGCMLFKETFPDTKPVPLLVYLNDDETVDVIQQSQFTVAPTNQDFLENMSLIAACAHNRKRRPQRSSRPPPAKKRKSS